MEIKVTEEAATWYKNELEIDGKGFIRFFPRYGGVGGHIPGFSIGINQDSPETAFSSTELNKITFYVEDKDAWYFEGVNLKVAFNKDLNEPKYIYK